MPDTPMEWVERYTATKLARLPQGNDLTVQLLRRSREQIETSLDLLKAEIPSVRHPERTTSSE
ncbi:hypothetical protein QA641_26530 [Bradyrhizobium sp. CB1650]|uniref:hypothetical protein n=1 Tax=Bradyrhizobium sp. CB1650 TaxID=3039153 RepID=UPI0024350E9E|nr:hypothetical protein [Bradyrhizobium sp. CB1650]WGD49188.1 hypothetical protein QA641_26530 [Bradyrhizobium sp. CB1650]